MLPQTVLVDRRTPRPVYQQLLDELAAARVVGIDTEFHDEAAHEGLKKYRKSKNKVIFDINRTVMTGFSLYPEGSASRYYVNLAHADVENRLTSGEAYEILNAIPRGAALIAHNAPVERVMFQKCLDYKLEGLVCTLQMAVSLYGPDQYSVPEFQKAKWAALGKIRADIREAFEDYRMGEGLDAHQADVLGKVISKESKAEHSYNGLVKSVAYTYGLKQAVYRWFGHQMTDFEELLERHGAAHMGELTGDQVADYGAEDAYWVVPLFRRFVEQMAPYPQLLKTFQTQENPMVEVFAEAWMNGLRVDFDAVGKKRVEERAEYATKLRALRAALKPFLPFPAEPDPELMTWQSFYAEPDAGGTFGWAKKRAQIERWIAAGDQPTLEAELALVSGSVSELKGPGMFSPTFWQSIRVIAHDLLGAKLVKFKGEIASDADARGVMIKRFEKIGATDKAKALLIVGELAGIEQRMKLYLTPYYLLTDPATQRMYAVISSMLATRRMAMSFPNAMQLEKGGYVRAFYLAESDQYLIVSADWNAIELVLIAQQSKDPAFLEVFSTEPYGDLHTGVTADLIGLPEAEFKRFKLGENPHSRRLVLPDGAEVDPRKFYSRMRTDVGKKANFGYWYSGALSDVGEILGWNSEEMWEAVDKYRTRFPRAEAWRLDTIGRVQRDGYVTLPDGHQRVRFEATEFWADEMRRKMGWILGAGEGIDAFIELVIKRLRSRAGNQAVNAMIQGTCATLAKRSILRIRREADPKWFKFMMPVHDELVHSVHRDYIPEFIEIKRRAMCDHPEIVDAVKLACAVAVGRTFRGYDPVKAPFGQIELDEASPVEGVIAPEKWGKKLAANDLDDVIRYLAA